jgi:hypothetical protein
MDEVMEALKKISEKLDMITGQKQAPAKEEIKSDAPMSAEIEIEPMDMDESEFEDEGEEGEGMVEDNSMEGLPQKPEGGVDIAMILGKKKKPVL